ncbi:hypothetical protein NZ698_18210 [Chryseobacterium sp. PBS4-4]|uniref:CHAT domain-containing protein n=1 Tax=Chryseobacterium edaphi TaxID=2976532 RepID=A0ABT2WA90_9FLAO|nr:hypothetical protein [Chryseobacterium edaphi]MCU7619117.1 hypothetical protein [Chryseobacterium edaphi]
MKKILIIRACGVPGEKEECDIIKNQAQLYGIEVHDYCPKNNHELFDSLNKGIQYDYIYISSHGDSTGFCDSVGEINCSWFEFGAELCSSMCMNEDCVIMLSCCRGGLNQVAYDLFYNCTKISYIVGPRQSLYPHDMLINFNILLYNLEHRRVDPIIACEKIQKATDIRFVCFDRLETEMDTSYMLYLQQIEEMQKELLLQSIAPKNDIITPIEVINFKNPKNE